MFKTVTATRTNTQQKIIMTVVMVLAVALLPLFGSIAFRGFVAMSSNTSTSMPLLIAYYNFNDAFIDDKGETKDLGKDSSGNNLDGWAVEMTKGAYTPNFLFTEDGVKGKAAVFGGDGDRIATGYNSLLDL